MSFSKRSLSSLPRASDSAGVTIDVVHHRRERSIGGAISSDHNHARESQSTEAGAIVGERPTITVVMPVYNSEQTLAEAIDSICAQTFPDWELLALDDGSRDDSLEISRVAAASDDRVKPIPLDHTGLAGTLIRGLELASGEFVARMDADDISLPDRFEKQVAFLRRNPEVAVVGGAAELFSDQGDLGRQMRHPCQPDAVAAVLEENNPLIHPSVMMRRAAVRDVGGYRLPFPPSEDYDLWLRVAERYRLANIPDVILRYRIGGSQESMARAAQQVMSVLAAQICRKERQRNRPDPLDGCETLVTRDWLAANGIDPPRIDRILLDGMAHRCWWLATIGLLDEADVVGRAILDIDVTPSESRGQRFLSFWSRFRVAVMAHDYRRAAVLFARAIWTSPVGAVARGSSALMRRLR